MGLFAFEFVMVILCTLAVICYGNVCYFICLFFSYLLTMFTISLKNCEELESECSVRILILLACIFGFLLIRSFNGYVHDIKDETKFIDKLEILFDETVFELIVCGGIGILVLTAILYFLLRFLLPA